MNRLAGAQKDNSQEAIVHLRDPGPTPDSAIGLLIPGILACVLASGLGAHADARGEALIVYNVRVYTPAGSGIRSAAGMIIEDGRVHQLLDSGSSPPTAMQAQRLDGGGATILPGLIDAHGHVLSLGQQRLQSA